MPLSIPVVFDSCLRLAKETQAPQSPHTRAPSGLSLPTTKIPAAVLAQIKRSLLEQSLKFTKEDLLHYMKSIGLTKRNFKNTKLAYIGALDKIYSFSDIIKLKNKYLTMKDWQCMLEHVITNTQYHSSILWCLFMLEQSFADLIAELKTIYFD